MTTVIMETSLTTDGGEDDYSYFGIAKYGKFHGFLQQAILTFGKGDGAVALVSYTLDENLLASHCENGKVNVTGRVGDSMGNATRAKK